MMMRMGDAARRLATFADLAALGDDARCEVLGGEIVEKAAPTFEHGATQLQIGSELLGPYQRGRGGPGGWWFGSEVDIELGPHDVFRPDVAGWRRDRVPERPSGRPVTVRPDWVCEILSPSTAARDEKDKFAVYHRARVGHYWIVDHQRSVLTVYRWTADGYLVALKATAGEVVRAEPFDAIELDVGLLLGREPLPEQ
jgi:Uma2 family endonuclease